MPTLLSLPNELLNQILYKLLVCDHRIWIWDRSPSFPCSCFKTALSRPHWTALLYANQRVHSLAAAILYGCNTFSITKPEFYGNFELAAPWLRSIGIVNAARITRLFVSFPGMKGGCQAGERMTFVEQGKDKLETILRLCTSLKVLRLQVDRLMIEQLESACRDEMCDDGKGALSEIDGYLKRMDKLERIEIDGYLLKSGTIVYARVLRHEMERLGWVFLAMDLDGA